MEPRQLLVKLEITSILMLTLVLQIFLRKRKIITLCLSFMLNCVHGSLVRKKDALINYVF